MKYLMGDFTIISDRDYEKAIAVPESGIWDARIQETEKLSSLRIMQDDTRVRSLLIPAFCIKERLKQMAQEIAGDYGPLKSLDLLVILTGSFILAADLGRELYCHKLGPVVFHLAKVSTYSKEIKGSMELHRPVQIDLEPGELKGRDIIIIEDIIDQGFTLTRLKDFLLNEKQVNSLKLLCLLSKQLRNPSEDVRRLRADLTIDYTGFEVPDVWVAGYGIDAGDEFRNLPCIISVKEECFR